MSTPNSAPSGFKIPFNIPGAPERATLPEITSTVTPLLRTSLDSFQGKPGAYEAALSQASWWHFWLLVTVSALVNAVCLALGLLISPFGFVRGILSILIYFILWIPIAGLVFYAGAYASHWWATKQAGGSASLVQHSYVIGVIWAGEMIISAVLGLIFSILRLGGIGSIVSLAVALYALYLIGGNIGRLYQFQDRNQVWITAAVMVVVSFLASLVLGSVLLSILI
jgi:hypothetical protein